MVILPLSLQLNPSYQQTEPSFLLVKFYKPRATSTTRTVFRLNTNQSRAYEESYYKIQILLFT